MNTKFQNKLLTIKPIINKAFGFITLSLLLFAASGVNANLYDDKAAVEREISQLNSQLKEIRAQKSTLASEVAAFDVQINKTQLEINATQVELNIVNEEINQVTISITKAEEDLKRQKVIMSEYIRTMYMDGQTSTVELIVKSDSFSDFVDQSEYLNTMQQKVQETAEKIASLKTELETKKKELDVKKAKIEELKASQLQQRAAIEIQRSSRNTVLQQTKGLESEFQSLINKERQKKAFIDQQIAGLNNTGTTSQSGYAWPFPGYSRSTLRYGVGTFIPFGESDYYFPGVYHTGIDIYGSAIKSASSGLVRRASYGWNGGYGNYVIVENGNHLVFYGHLSSIAVSEGQYVTIGQYLGQEGTSGNSTGPHLHFEIRVNNVARDPLNYLP